MLSAAMQAHTDRTIAFNSQERQSIEVRLRKTSPGINIELLNTLSAFAIGGGPIKSPVGDLAFRFPSLEWEEIIKPFLVLNRRAFKVITPPEREPLSDFVKKKIYLVEGDLETLFTLNAMLEEAGYDVLLSHCAAPLMEEQLPETDVFILDQCMPDGDGLQICRKIRRRAETSNIPVIMISASDEISDNAAAAGANEFLVKPFAMQDLLAAVSRYTNQFSLNTFPDAAQ
jgi:CheY-like chemotaxis protein